jgi:L-lactate utilization protein LutB
VAIKEWQEFQKEIHKMVTKKVRSWYAELQKRVEARGNIRYFTTEEKEILDKQ